MPYSRPALQDLRNQVLQDIASAQITDASGTISVGLLQKAILRILADAQAGLSYEHYGFLDYIALQAAPWTATGSFLEAWAALKDVFRLQPTAATGSVTFPAAGAGVASIATGASITRIDGLAFSTIADATPTGGQLTLSVTAAQPGSGGSFDNNTAFILSSPVDGVTAQSAASTQLKPGTDLEADEALRARMLAAFAAAPQGGDRADYIQWAMASVGVTRAWVAPNVMGPGTVVVFVMLDVVQVANAGFPQGANGVSSADTRAAAAAGDQLAVANAIYPLQPVTALVYVASALPQTVDFAIADLGSNNTPTIQTQIQNSLAEMLSSLGQPGGSVDAATGAAWLGFEPSDWYAALEGISGLTKFKVTTPAAAVAPAPGCLLTLGNLTFAA